MKSLGLPLALSLACHSPQDTAISEWVDLGNGLMPGSSLESEEEQFEPREETLVTVNIRDTAEAVDTAVPEEEEEAVLYSEIDLESCIYDYRDYREVNTSMYCDFDDDLASISEDGILNIDFVCEISSALEERPLIFMRSGTFDGYIYQLLPDVPFDFHDDHISSNVEVDVYEMTGASSKPELNDYSFQIYLFRPDCLWFYLEPVLLDYSWVSDSLG
jgi:hypothetical protein